jgi:hypothetical protein
VRRRGLRRRQLGHGRAAPGPARLQCRPRRRGDHRGAHRRGHGRRHPAGRRHAGAGGHRPRDLHDVARGAGRGHHPAHQGGDPRASLRPPGGPARHRRRGADVRPLADRRLRPGSRRAEPRPACRQRGRPGMFLFLPHQEPGRAGRRRRGHQPRPRSAGAGALAARIWVDADGALHLLCRRDEQPPRRATGGDPARLPAAPGC